MFARSMFFVSGVLLIATSQILLAEESLRVRSKGYAQLSLDQVAKVNVLDGLSLQEVAAIAEWRILGAIDIGDIEVKSILPPKRVGEHWVVNVHYSVGSSDKGPLLIDRVTGESHGEKWVHTSVPYLRKVNVDVGLVRARDGKVNLTVRAVRWDENLQDEPSRKVFVKNLKEVVKKVSVSIEEGGAERGDLEKYVHHARWSTSKGVRYEWRAKVPLSVKESR